TRFSRDWSSDVCSSDLARELVDDLIRAAIVNAEPGDRLGLQRASVVAVGDPVAVVVELGADAELAARRERVGAERGTDLEIAPRSEERRGGNAGSAGWR